MSLNGYTELLAWISVVGAVAIDKTHSYLVKRNSKTNISEMMTKLHHDEVCALKLANVDSRLSAIDGKIDELRESQIAIISLTRSLSRME
jgi:hypothetical protein